MNGHEARRRRRGMKQFIGRGAFRLRGSRAARHGGAGGKANVGMSNDNAGAKPAHRKTKVS